MNLWCVLQSKNAKDGGDIIVSRIELQNQRKHCCPPQTKHKKYILHTVLFSFLPPFFAGEYSCVYTQTLNKITIIHKANATMDVCLKPEIQAFTDPQFLLCTSSNEDLVVTVKCKTPKSHEKYNVTWSNVLTILDDSEHILLYFLIFFVSYSEKILFLMIILSVWLLQVKIRQSIQLKLVSVVKKNQMLK